VVSAFERQVGQGDARIVNAMLVVDGRHPLGEVDDAGGADWRRRAETEEEVSLRRGPGGRPVPE
jgi:hypothetical protein